MFCSKLKYRANPHIFSLVRIFCMSSPPPTKKFCSSMKIATHNGNFHCDEVLACFLLRRLPEYKDAEIVRTRNAELIDSADIVVDVGGVYDASKKRFDHHQRTFSDTMNSLNAAKKWTTKLSSAGLVYYHFGQRIIADILELKENDPITGIIYDKVYENFVEEIDAIDNGINQYDGEPKYHISTTISSRVGNLNPLWNDDNVDEMSRFLKAMNVVGEEFLDRVLYYKKAWLPARELVETAVQNRKDVDPSGEVIVFSSGGCPWKDHLFNLEEELKIEPKIKYVLYTDQNGKWRIQCVPLRLGSFENRLSMPEEWRGLRDSALSEKSGIPGCIFVHAGGFIGGNDTYDGVLQMAKYSLKQQLS